MDINVAKEELKKFNKTLLENGDFKTSHKIAYICDIHKDKGIQYGYYHNLLRGHGCVECGKVKTFGNKRLTINEYRNVAEEKGLEFIDVLFKNNASYIRFTCNKCGHSDIQEMNFQNFKSSKIPCKYCRQIDYSYESFIKQLNILFPNVSLISEYTGKANDEILLECELDGCKWETKPIRVLNQKQGCPICGRKRSDLCRLKTHEQFVEEMSNKLPHIKIVSEYTGSHNNIECSCLIHNINWITTPTVLLKSSYGCAKCVSQETHNRCVKSNDEFLKQLKEISQQITPLEPYINSHSKIKCLCTVHNYIWDASPLKLLYRGTGCPKCSCSSCESKLDVFFNKYNIKFECQKRYDICKDKNVLPFDRYLPEYNVLIEYDGEQHYYPVNFGGITDKQAQTNFQITQLHDNIKNAFCTANNIPLIRIPYWEKNNLEEFVKNKLLELNIKI